jgi:segregation and condensation protein A
MSERPEDPDDQPAGVEAPSGEPTPAATGPKDGDAGAAERSSDSGERESTGAEPGAYNVSLPAFEGPLDLLLHLIQKHELDILDIPIGFIAREYVAYIRMMEELSIDVASEYLVMAATLALIKSRTLLPPEAGSGEDELPEEEDDPRAELIRRLLEYQKYKQAAAQLGGRDVLGRDVFPRGTDIEASIGPAPLAQISLFKLVDAFEEVLKRARQVEDHEIDFERISISEKIGVISDQLRQRGPQRFEQLFEADASRAELIVTFLALLEMTKLRMTHLTQDDPLGPIMIELRVREDEGDDDAVEIAGSDESSESSEDPEEDDVLARRPDTSGHRHEDSGASYSDPSAEASDQDADGEARESFSSPQQIELPLESPPTQSDESPSIHDPSRSDEVAESDEDEDATSRH